MNFQIITIFPEILDSYFKEGMIGRALKKKIIKIKAHNLRKWTTDNHKTVDDSPYGGGAGMVMKAEPIIKALRALKLKIKNACLSGRQTKLKIKKNNKIILLSAKGKKWTQKMAREYSKLDNIIFVCGRYEGVDERVLNFIDEEISIGDYVLTGGELGAAVIIDSITRLLPGVLGNKESAIFESHSEDGVLEYPQYTRPEILTVNKKNYKVPEVLLSGNHSEIAEWRKKKSTRL
jgi:tRNA (guanine37-N1)-methyltransferase